MALACCWAAATWEESRRLRLVEISCVEFRRSVRSLLYDQPEPGRLVSSALHDEARTATYRLEQRNSNAAAGDRGCNARPVRPRAREAPSSCNWHP
jgi:hypothetical protein